MLALVIAGTGQVFPCRSEETNATTADGSNYLNSLPAEVKQDPERRRFFESMTPEIERNAQVTRAIHAAVETNQDVKARAWHDFLAHWPSAKQNLGFAWNENENRFKGGVDATGLIESRYVLQAILDCDVSKDYKKATFTRLRFHFMEVKHVSVSAEGAKEGGAMVNYETQSDKWLDLKEWEQLKRANWDFGTVGINVISNAPIPHIEEVFKQ